MGRGRPIGLAKPVVSPSEAKPTQTSACQPKPLLTCISIVKAVVLSVGHKRPQPSTQLLDLARPSCCLGTKKQDSLPLKHVSQSKLFLQSRTERLWQLAPVGILGYSMISLNGARPHRDWMLASVRALPMYDSYRDMYRSPKKNPPKPVAVAMLSPQVSVSSSPFLAGSLAKACISKSRKRRGSCEIAHTPKPLCLP